MVGVVRLTWRGQVQVVVAAAKLAVGGLVVQEGRQIEGRLDGSIFM